MIVHITRHGQVLPAGPESWSDADYPPGDMPLSSLGREQATLLGRRLEQMGFSGIIYASPYRRTVETACQIADQVDALVVPVAPLREIVQREGQMGGFVGLTAGQLRDTFPRARPAADFCDSWWTAEQQSDDDVEARVAPFVDAAISTAFSESAGSDVVFVGHGASTGAVIRHLLRRAAPELIGPPIPGWNCSLSSFDCAATGTVELLRHLDTEHLPESHTTSNGQSRAEVLATQARTQAQQ